MRTLLLPLAITLAAACATPHANVDPDGGRAPVVDEDPHETRKRVTEAVQAAAIQRTIVRRTATDVTVAGPRFATALAVPPRLETYDDAAQVASLALENLPFDAQAYAAAAGHEVTAQEAAADAIDLLALWIVSPVELHEAALADQRLADRMDLLDGWLTPAVPLR